MKKKPLSWTILLFLSPYLISCENNGAFQDFENVESGEVKLASVNEADDLRQRLIEIEGNLARSSDESLSEEERMGFFSSARDSMSNLGNDMDNFFETNYSALETEYRALNCVPENHANFQSLLSSIQKRCRDIKKRIDDLQTWRNRTVAPLQDIDQLAELFNGEVNIITVLGASSSLTNLSNRFNDLISLF